MTTIRITRNSVLPPARVLLAAHDFSGRRVQVWPAVRTEHLIVHSRGETSADVTEGTPTGIGTSWERCDYDWSTPGTVVATVTDSNVYASSGSAWRVTAREADGGGSEVEMTWIRRFRRSPRGLLFGTLFRLAGRPIFGGYVRDVIRNMERLDDAPPHVGQASAGAGSSPS
jgi:hypothetical protein